MLMIMMQAGSFLYSFNGSS